MRKPTTKNNELKVIIDENGKISIKGRPAFSSDVNVLGSNPGKSDRRHMLHWSEHLRGGLEKQLNALNNPKEQEAFITDMLQYNNIKYKSETSLAAKIKLLCVKINSNPKNLVWGNEKDNKGIENARDFLEKNKKAFLDGDVNRVTKENRKFYDTTSQVYQLMCDMINANLDRETKEKIWNDMYDSVTLDVCHKGSTRDSNIEGLRRMRYFDLAEKNLGTAKGLEYFKYAVSIHSPPSV